MLTMRGGPQVPSPGVKMGRPPPVPPRPDKSLVADALAKSRKVPAPVLPLSLKKDVSPPSENQKPPTPDKLPSPKLNGLSRVKSFIRDVISDKKNSEDKNKSESENKLKSHIPIPQSQPIFNKNKNVSMNHPTEQSVKNHSSQSVVRSLCSVLVNSDITATKDKIKIIKSNSFAEKAVPVRRAPPPPISPKPNKKIIEEKTKMSNGTFKKLSASCEELNNSTPRPVVYQSNPSPALTRKNVPPNLPVGKPSFFSRKRSVPSSPITPSPEISSLENSITDPLSSADFSTIDSREMLMSELVSAKNDVLVSHMSDKIETKHSDDNAKVKCGRDDVSMCSSDGSAGKTVLFINNDAVSESTNPLLKSAVEVNGTKDYSTVHLNDMANREMLMSELQNMRRDAANGRAAKAQSQSSSESENGSNGEKIQHSDWLQVEDNGEQVRYSSCQIVIEDSAPVDDSGVCLDDNFYSPDELPYCLSPSLVSRLKEQFCTNQKMSSLQGLPPLPKSLSGFNVGEGDDPPPPFDAAPPVPVRGPNTFRYAGGSPPSPATPSSTGGSGINGGSSSSSSDMHNRHPRKVTTLDTQLALLKREMLSLRQLDLSLLSQLWSLNESIHEFRQYMNERNNGSGVPEDDDDMEDEGDDSSSGEENTPRSQSHTHRGRTPV